MSPDAQQALHAFREKLALPFLLLSDPEHIVAQKYGAWGEKQRYGKAYMGVIRSHFVIDEAGRIQDAQIKVSPEDSVRLSVQAVTA